MERQEFSSWREALAYCLELHRAGEWQRAAEGYAQLHRQNPQDSDLLRFYGLVLGQLGRPTEGLPYMQEALRLAPKHSDAHAHMGYLLVLLDKGPQAIPYLLEAQRLNRQDPGPAINLAFLYLQQGDVPRALAQARTAVTLAPESPEARHNLGLALNESRSFGVAVEVLRQGVQQHPQHGEMWFQLGRAYAELGNLEEAECAYAETLRLQASHIGAANNLAGLWLRRGAYEQAIKLYQQILQHHPERWESRLSLVSCYAGQEQIEEAIRCLEGVLPPPERARDWRLQKIELLLQAQRHEDARILLQQESQQDLRLALIEYSLTTEENRAAKRAALALSLQEDALAAHDQRMQALFLLANAAHAAADYQQARQYYEQAHTAMRVAEPYDHDRWLQEMQQDLQRWDSAQFPAWQPALPADWLPLFIIGMPRSGTTLVEQILDTHVNVSGAGERSDLARIRAYTALHGVAEPGYQPMVEKYLASMRAVSSDSRYVCDKMPHNFTTLPWIARLFPQSPIIVCRRNPQDNALSIWRQYFSGRHAYAHDWESLAQHYAAHESLIAQWRQRIDNPFWVIDYEQLVEDFSGTVSSLLDFLGLPWQEGLENFYRNPRTVRTASRDQVRRPLYRDAIGQWQQYAQAMTAFTPALERARLQAAQETHE